MVRHLIVIAVLGCSGLQVETGFAQVLHSLLDESVNGEKEDRQLLSGLRSQLLQAEMAEDDQKVIGIASRIVGITEGIDLSLPSNALVAIDRIEALKTLFERHRSLAQDRKAACAQEKVVKTSEAFYPSNSDMVLKEQIVLARQYFMMYEYADALEVLGRTSETCNCVHDPETCIRLWSLLSRAQVKLGRYDDAKKSITSLKHSLEKLRCNDMRKLTLTMLSEYSCALAAYHVERDGDYDAAARGFGKTLALIEKESNHRSLAVATMSHLAYCHIQQSRYGESEACFQKACSLAAEESALGNELTLLLTEGLLRLRQGRHDEAISVLSKVVSSKAGAYGGVGENASRCIARVRLAEAYIETKRFDDAESLLHEVLRYYAARKRAVFPLEPVAMRLLGKICLERKQYAQAEKIILESVALRKEHGKENPRWMQHPGMEPTWQDLGPPLPRNRPPGEGGGGFEEGGDW